MTNDDDFDPEWVNELNLDDPVKRAQFMGQLQLMKAAWKFLETAVRDGDLRAAWGLVHESLREQMAQQTCRLPDSTTRKSSLDWRPIRPHTRCGFTSSACTCAPSVRCYRTATTGRSARTRELVGPDLEALYVHDKSQLPPNGLWQPGTVSEVCALTFQRVGDQWLLAMIGNNELLDDVL